MKLVLLILYLNYNLLYSQELKKIESKTKNKSTTPDLLEGLLEDYQFDPSKNRNPFSPFREQTIFKSSDKVTGPLEKFPIEELKLVGVLWDVSVPKAMIIDPNQKAYIATINTKIGLNMGKISQISNGEIVIEEKRRDLAGKLEKTTRTLKLQQDIVNVSAPSSQGFTKKELVQDSVEMDIEKLKKRNETLIKMGEAFTLPESSASENNLDKPKEKK